MLTMCRAPPEANRRDSFFMPATQNSFHWSAASLELKSQMARPAAFCGVGVSAGESKPRRFWLVVQAAASKINKMAAIRRT